MSVKFTAGDSISTTNHTRPPNKVAEPSTSSMKLRGGNTMSGMPGKIGTSMTTSGRSLAKSGGGAMTSAVGGPKSIGQKGGSAKRLNSPGKKAAGTMMTGSLTKGGAGKMESMKGRTATKAEGRKSKSMMY